MLERKRVVGRFADPASPTEVANGLLPYLAGRTGIRRLRFAENPSEFKDGWETYTYHFQLEPASSLPTEFNQPLIARIYSSPEGRPRAKHEFDVLRHMRRLGYAVPEPLLLEESSECFGGPFLIVAQAPGRNLLKYLLNQPWRIFVDPARMAEAHARLHGLPADGFPTSPGSFLTRHLKRMAKVIRDHDLGELSSGLAWLVAQRPPPAKELSIVHLDFHPINLIHHPAHSLVVLDWPEADVGDPHADVATTLMLMECVQPETERIYDRVALHAGRWLCRRWYLRAYRRRRSLDTARLAYFRAWAALRRLCIYGQWLRAGPQSTGSKPSLLEHLHLDHLETLQNYFHKWTRVRACLKVS